MLLVAKVLKKDARFKVVRAASLVAGHPPRLGRNEAVRYSGLRKEQNWGRVKLCE
jgi:hypothetical protein